MNKKFFIHTFGCQMNQYDSELVAGILNKAGLSRVDVYEKADICLVNSCSVRELAAQKARSELGMFAAYKRKNEKRVYYGIIGCLAEQEGKRLCAKFPDIDFIIGPAYERCIDEYVEKVISGNVPAVATGAGKEDWEVDALIKRDSKKNAWVTVSKGCNSFCSYCVVPYVRGREVSRPFESILPEAERLAAEGYKEINLIGQNVNTYGKDFPAEKSHDFSGLLKAVDAVKGEFWIRFWTSHPKDIPLKLIETVASSKKICPHFHLPVQSGSDRILKLMNRRYTSGAYLRITEEIKKRMKFVSISSDIIVGFPGETEADFKRTMELYEKAAFDVAYTYTYSPRKGTKAFDMKDNIPEKVKEERLKALMELQKRISQKVNEKYIGQILPVLLEVDSLKENVMSGRTHNNKPIFVEVGHGKTIKQEFVSVKITQANPFSLKGVIEANSKY
ncbi:MAG: tRNA (N6-isopentenyl adenosine(37)-C2)-methylthiotransferase MiaB [Candidatus Firestonebacteria bacterium]